MSYSKEGNTKNPSFLKGFEYDPSTGMYEKEIRLSKSLKKEINDDIKRSKKGVK